MHDAVLDGHVRGSDLGPSLRLQLGQQLSSDPVVIGSRATRGFVDRHGERPHEVCPTDDSDELAVAHNRNALDPVRLQQKCNIGDGGRFGDGKDVAGHDVLHLAAMRLDVVSGELVRRRHHVEPPCSAALRSRFGAMQQITLADHADYLVALIDDRDRADATLGQQSRDCRHSRIRVDRNHFTGHDVDSAHRIASGRLGKYQNIGLLIPRIDPDQFMPS